MLNLLASDAAPETAVRLASTSLLDAHCRQSYGDQARLEGLLASRDPLRDMHIGAPSIGEVRFARALAFMDSGGPPGVAAMRILSRIMDDRHAELLSCRDVDLLYQLRLIHDRSGLDVAQLPSLLTHQVRMEITADLLHPDLTETPSHSDWQRAFSRAVGIDCVVPESAWDAGRTEPFDHVGFRKQGKRVSGGALVSVITSCYRPDRSLISAIRSLCDQTWPELELIIVDDGSGRGFQEVLHEVAELDPRVRVVRNSANRGTYARRNQGLDLARGRYITFQDADDLSAPVRVQRHVEAMENDSGLVGTLSSGAKVEPNLQVTRPGYRSIDANAQSLMLRASVVLPRLGYFHETRRAADGEYIRRLKASFGEQAVGNVGTQPLMLYRRTPGSLSSADFSPGRRSRRRWAYQMITHHRHRSARGASEHFTSRRAARSADFGLVAAEAARTPSTPQTFDVAYLADFRPCSPGKDALRYEVERTLARGLRVAVGQCDRSDQLSTSDGPLATWVLDALLARSLSLLLDDSVALITHLVVESAEAVALGLLPRARWSAQSVELRTTTTACGEAAGAAALRAATITLESG